MLKLKITREERIDRAVRKAISYCDGIFVMPDNNRRWAATVLAYYPHTRMAVHIVRRVRKEWRAQ